MSGRSIQFAEAGRALTLCCRQEGLTAPAFRSPPGSLHRDRTIRRRPDGYVSVAVRITGRPFAAVLADMVEGIVAVNDLDVDRVHLTRRRLWDAVAEVAERVQPAA